MHHKKKLYEFYVSSHIKNRRNSPEKQKNLRDIYSGYTQHFGAIIPENKDVEIIDYGCGSGNLLCWLDSLGYKNIRGVDGSPEQIALANEKVKNVVKIADVFDEIISSSANNERFDVIFCVDLLEHFESKDAYRFIEHCFDILNDGGLLIIQVPNAESPFFGALRYGDFTHELAFTESSIRQVFLSIGFSFVGVHSWRPSITSRKSILRYLAWRIIEFLIKLPIRIESGKADPIVTKNIVSVGYKEVLEIKR